MHSDELPTPEVDEIIVVYGSPGGTPAVSVVTRSRDVACAAFNSLVQLNGEELTEAEAIREAASYPEAPERVCRIDGRYYLASTGRFDAFIDIFRVL